ncbi:MAG: hypothetical protein CME61_00985 [Halobacteriovoraceae bacterium]|nr:hypothetical protein [Halobacteriovoraceae bacterium]
MKILVFLLIIISRSISANELTLYFFPSPYKFDWDSPQTLARSVLKNSYLPTKFLFRHALGHVSTEIKCEDGFYHLSGMTTKEKSEDVELLLNKKIGLGIMFYPMKGKLQSEIEVRSDLRDRYKKGKMNWLTFKIKSSTCERLKSYIQEYKSQNLDSVYGLVFNPRKKEGAGCSAFGISLLELSGLLTDEFKTEFAQRLYINNDLNGYNGSTDKASFYKILAGLNSRDWAQDTFTGKELFFWRPNKMYEWVKNKIRKVSKMNLRNYEIIKRGNTFGLKIDKTHVGTPNGPIFIK